MMNRKYETIYYKDLTSALLVGILSICMAMALFIYLGKIYDSNILGICIPLLIVILPICCSKFIKKKFKERLAASCL